MQRESFTVFMSKSNNRSEAPRQSVAERLSQNHNLVESPQAAVTSPTLPPPPVETSAVYFRWPKNLIADVVMECARRRSRGEKPWTQQEVAQMAMREWLDRQPK